MSKRECVSVTIGEAEARSLAIRHLANPSWEPSIVEIEELPDAWRVFYNSKAYVETADVSHALAGNLPLLIDKVTGTITSDMSFAPGSDRWRT